MISARRGRALIASALLATAIAVLETPVQAASPSLRPLGTATEPPIGSPNYLVWKSSSTVLMVRDSRVGHQSSLQVPAGCAPHDLSHGAILLGCTGSSDSLRPALADIATKTVRDLAGAEFRDSYRVLGRHWLGGSNCSVDPPVCRPVALNRTTGQRAEADIDLDAPDVRAAPAPRRPTTRIIGRDIRSPGPKADLRLRRRGRTDVLLSTCPGGCYDAQLSFGRVAWLRGSRVYGFTVRGQHRRSWVLPRSLRKLDDQTIRFNAHEIAVIESGSTPSAARRLYAASWRR